MVSEFQNLNQVEVNRNTQKVGVDSEQKYVTQLAFPTSIGRVMERSLVGTCALMSGLNLLKPFKA